MGKLIYLRTYKDALEAAKKDCSVIFPPTGYRCRFLAFDLERKRYKYDRALYIYLYCLFLAYLRDKEKYEKVLPLIENDIDNLNEIYKPLFQARLYCTGVIYKKDVDKAISILEDLTKINYDAGKWGLLRAYSYSDKDYSEKQKDIILEFVNKEDPLSYTRYAECLYDGYLFEKNKPLALHYLLKAYEANNCIAIFGIAIYYYDKQDYKTAIKYLKEGIKYDNPNCMLLLGDLYRDGKGVDKDLDEAMELYNSAFLNGYLPAKIRQAHLYLIGTPKHKKEPYKAIAILELYKGEKDAYYYFLYGCCHIDKQYRSIAKADQMFQKALELNDDLRPANIRFIADFYKEYYKDDKQAQKLYSLADNMETKLSLDSEMD